MRTSIEPGRDGSIASLSFTSPGTRSRSSAGDRAGILLVAGRLRTRTPAWGARLRRIGSGRERTTLQRRIRGFQRVPSSTSGLRGPLDRPDPRLQAVEQDPLILPDVERPVDARVPRRGAGRRSPGRRSPSKLEDRVLEALDLGRLGLGVLGPVESPGPGVDAIRAAPAGIRRPGRCRSGWRSPRCAAWRATAVRRNSGPFRIATRSSASSGSRIVAVLAGRRAQGGAGHVGRREGQDQRRRGRARRPGSSGFVGVGRAGLRPSASATGPTTGSGLRRVSAVGPGDLRDRRFLGPGASRPAATCRADPRSGRRRARPRRRAGGCSSPSRRRRAGDQVERRREQGHEACRDDERDDELARRGRGRRQAIAAEQRLVRAPAGPRGRGASRCRPRGAGASPGPRSAGAAGGRP